MINLVKIPQKIGYYISGFVDGEGSFNVSLRKKQDYKIKWQVVLSFNVSQKDIFMLEIIKKYLDCGIIKCRKKDGLFSYDVTNPLKIVENVIPFFDQFCFLSTNKTKNYLLFKQIAYLVANKEHLTVDGFRKVLSIREKLNLGRGRKRKYTLSNVLKESSETTRQISKE